MRERILEYPSSHKGAVGHSPSPHYGAVPRQRPPLMRTDIIITPLLLEWHARHLSAHWAGPCSVQLPLESSVPER